MRIGVKAFIIILTFMTFSSLFGKVAEASVLSDLEDKQEEIKDERAEIKEDLSEAEAEIADLLLDLKELNHEIKELESALEQNETFLEETEEEITNLEDEIQGLEDDISELEDAIEKRNEILKERIQSYQKSGGNVGFLQVLFGARSFSEFISRISAVTKITNSDQELIEKQEEDKEQVKKVQNNVQRKLDEQKEMKVELKGIKELTLEQKEQTENSKEKLEKKEKKLKKKKKKLKSRDSKLSTLEAEVRRDITNAQNRVARSNDNHSPGGELEILADNPVSGSGNIEDAIRAGSQFIGNTRYIWNSASPANGGFDCSGFVSWAFGQAGYNLPSSTAALRTKGQKVSYSDIQRGDLVFFNTYKTDGHVGIYLGNGQFLGSQSSSGVDVASMSNSYWRKAFTGHVRRIR